MSQAYFWLAKQLTLQYIRSTCVRVNYTYDEEIKMASPTKKLKVRRAMAIANAGKKRKNAIRRNGTTAPSLKLDKPNANELAQKAAK